MQQRTCNIIMCCKGGCAIKAAKSKSAADAIAAYMSKECGCPVEVYNTHTMQSILYEALFDFIATAQNPAFELRTLLKPCVTHDPSMSERIMTMFSLTQVMDNGHYMNGFTEQLIKQSEKDLSDDGPAPYDRRTYDAVLNMLSDGGFTDEDDAVAFLEANFPVDPANAGT